MILLIDNYDSFTFNLAQYLGELGAELHVMRNDKVAAPDILALDPEGIVISPGPCTPNEAGVSNDVIQVFGERTPILGVCLGHQCIGQAYGGRIVRAPHVMHGKTSLIHHTGDPLFEGIPSPFEATRYHSLVIEPESLPADLDVIASTEDGIIMGVRHKRFPVWGVQFHPESILTKHGKRLLANFLGLAKQG